MYYALKKTKSVIRVIGNKIIHAISCELKSVRVGNILSEI